MSHQKLVHVCIGDSDPYTAGKVNNNIRKAIECYFRAELITKESLLWNKESTLWVPRALWEFFMSH